MERRMISNGLPPPGTCPACGGEFDLVGRSGSILAKAKAQDELAWKCAKCGHGETEVRELANGVDGGWPVSRFARKT